jgi:hypothetical protein
LKRIRFPIRLSARSVGDILIAGILRAPFTAIFDNDEALNNASVFNAHLP